MNITLELVLTVLLSLVFLYLSFECFRVVLKKYEEDDEEVLNFLDYGNGFLTVFAILLAGILWFSEKLFPPPFYFIFFKSIVFLFGIGMLILVYFIWEWGLYKPMEP